MDSIADFSDKHYVYHLDEGMLEALEKDFNAEKLTDKVAQAVTQGTDVRTIYEEYGEKLVRETLRRGQESQDRTYGVIEEVISQTNGAWRFPHLPQRFLEIAYLSTLRLDEMDILENWRLRLTYRVDSCRIFDNLKQRCAADIVSTLPCKYACLKLSQVLYEQLNMDVKVEMDALMTVDGYCQFSATRVVG